MRFRSGTTTAVRFRFGLAPLLCPSLRCAPWVGALPHQRSVASNVAGILSFAASVASKRIGVRNPPSTRRLPMRICKSWLLPGTEPAAGPARKPSFKQKFLPQNQRLTNNIQTRFGFCATRHPPPLKSRLSFFRFLLFPDDFSLRAFAASPHVHSPALSSDRYLRPSAGRRSVFITPEINDKPPRHTPEAPGRYA